MESLLDRWLGWFPLYRMAIGGYRYYSHMQAHTYTPDQFCRCGMDVRIGVGTVIRSPKRMQIGDHVFIAGDGMIDATGGLRIGDCCALAHHVSILTLDHRHRDAESIPWDETRLIKPVIIEDYAWIGMNASILPGVTVGEGAIVGMAAVVPKDVPPRAIVVGNPARIVGYRNVDDYQSFKTGGKIKPANSNCARLWVPPEMREKYAQFLKDVGYDITGGQEYFEFVKEP